MIVDILVTVLPDFQKSIKQKVFFLQKANISSSASVSDKSAIKRRPEVLFEHPIIWREAEGAGRSEEEVQSDSELSEDVYSTPVRPRPRIHIPIPSFKIRLSSITKALAEEIDNTDLSVSTALESQAPIEVKRERGESLDSTSTDGKPPAKKQKKEDKENK